ncbi:MAG: DUF6989 domain-containing protein [Archangium sp.]
MPTMTPQLGVLAAAGTVDSSHTTELDGHVRRTRFVIAVLTLVVLMNGGAAMLIQGNPNDADRAWEYAVASTAMTLGIFSAYCYGARDRSLLRWGVVALTAGFIELAADAWLVLGTETLNYTPWGRSSQLMIWESPAYMPFAWTGVLLQIITIGDALNRRMKLWLASLITALIGGINIPLYEAWAFNADWWAYRDTPTIIKNAPYFIALGEFLMCLPLVWAARQTASASFRRCVAYGALLGVGIFASYWLAYQVMGSCGGHMQGLDFGHGCSLEVP